MDPLREQRWESTWHGTSAHASVAITSDKSGSISVNSQHVSAWERRHQLHIGSAVGSQSAGAWHGTSVHGRDVIICQEQSLNCQPMLISACK